VTAPERLERFTAAERLYHWAQALPFLALLATGGLLLVERLTGVAWIQQATLVLAHQIAAISLGVCLLLALVWGRLRIHLQNLRLAFTWGRQDLIWFWRMPLQRFVPGVQVPPAGKFNPGQKLNLAAQLILLIVLATSGILMWLERGALLAWYVHLIAFLLSMPLVLGHLYLALLHPTTRRGLRGVLDGQVDASWAREHYPLYYPEPDE
jgi:formate dehydrogenase subunit gamma